MNGRILEYSLVAARLLPQLETHDHRFATVISVRAAKR
jgi:hypothetical protein